MIKNDFIPKWVALGLGIPIVIFLIIGVLLTFVDFLTQGFLKKKKWLSKIYFPFYWVFSFLTLSFLYRPLVHNFLDNKFGKRLSYILLPFYVTLSILTSLTLKESNYFSKKNISNKYYSNNRNYESLLSEKGDNIAKVALSSKVVKESVLKVFIVYSKKIEDRIFKTNKGLKPEKDQRGLSLQMDVSDPNKEHPTKQDSLKREYIKTFNKTYRLFIDSLQYKSDFILGESVTEELGFESYINIKELPEGKHFFYLKRDEYSEKDTTEVVIRTIPFWYYKD